MNRRSRLIACVGCGARVPDIEGPGHPYIGASPGCWAACGELNARELGDYRHLAGAHRLSADVYPVQHPGVPSRRAIQSVAVHLVSLHLVVERGLPPAAALAGLRRALDHKASFVWLDPPDFSSTLNVLDVLEATGPEEHVERVERWARSVWSAWEPHHERVREWAARSLEGDGG